MEGGDARPQILGKFKVEYLLILHKVSSMVSTSKSNGNVDNQLTKLLLLAGMFRKETRELSFRTS